MKMELQNVKGSRDFGPEEQLVRFKIRRVLEQTFQKYGYQPMETPIINYFELLASKYGGGEEILKEVYRFNDQGGRNLGLRYDLTVPFTKFVGMNPYMTLPFKRYEIGKVFRDGPVKTGRMREFIQCDVDVVGISSMLAEAELLMMVVEVFEKLALDICIQYNNRKILSGILKGLSISNDLVKQVILVLDKIEKVGVEEVTKELLEKGIGEDTVNELFQLLEEMKSVDDPLIYLTKRFNNQLIQEGAAELEELNCYLNVLGIGERLRFNPYLARGLNIYTGTVFETFLIEGEITSSLAAGGRYDNIVGDLLENGREYPVVGLTFGLDVIYTALELMQEKTQKSVVDLYVIPLGTQLQALKLVKELRRENMAVDLEMEGRKLRKSLDYANKVNIPFVMILGENELDTGQVQVKDMTLGIEREVCLANVVEDLKQIFG